MRDGRKLVRVGNALLDSAQLEMFPGNTICCEKEIYSKASGGEDNPAPRPDDSESVWRSVVGRGHGLGGSNDHVNEGETDQRGRVEIESGSGREGSDRAVLVA